MRKLSVAVCCFAVGAIGGPVLAQQERPGQPERPNRPQRPEGAGGAGRGGGEAQPGGTGGEARGGQRGGQALSPEKAKAAWAAEATGVAKRLGASDEQTAAVVKAYTEARESQGAASQKLMQELREKAQQEGGRGMGPEAMQEIEKLNASEREKLKTSLSATLSPEQTTQAMATLGTFDRGWDNMVDAVTGFGLEPAKQQEALTAIETFVAARAKARADAMAEGGDREAMMSAMQESRKKLMDSMKGVLSEEQMDKFEASMRRGGPGMGPRGGGRGEGGGGGGGDDGDGNGRRRQRGGGGGGGGAGGGGGGR